MPKLLSTTFLSLLIAGCSSQPVTNWHADLVPTSETFECLLRLANSTTSLPYALDAQGFTMINWNIQKGWDADWIADLHNIHPAPDMLILQEVSQGEDTWDSVASEHFHSFAQGYANSKTSTGVMTTSRAQPLTECRLVAFEPWLRTRKATLVTEYALTDTDQTLLVVNIHGVNFTLGINDMREQLRQVQAIIEQHDGAIVLAGDFNTWNDRRAAVLRQLVDDVGLVAIDYRIDHRTKIFGQVLDHVYVRGLDSVYATTMELQSSDHNPMSVRLRLTKEPRSIKAAL